MTTKVVPVPHHVLPTVGVVVCCYTDRRRQEILDAVASVAAQSTRPAEIIVVVDHNPALREWLSTRLPDVVLIENAGRRGLTDARNTGVAASGSDVVAFLDDDAVAEPGWLASLVGEYLDPQVIAAGGRIDPRWTAGAPAWFPPEFGWVVGCSYRGLPARRSVVRNVIGANMSFRRDVVEQVGGFRHELGRVGTLPVGCEETELCIRASSRSGGVVVYQPAAVVVHTVPGDRATAAYFRSRCWSEGTSKAAVARFAGAGRALESERRYVARVLPEGLFRALGAGLAGRPGGFGRALAIVVGLACTTAGYVVGRVRLTLAELPGSSR